MSVSEILSLLKTQVLLQIKLGAEVHLAERLTL